MFRNTQGLYLINHFSAETLTTGSNMLMIHSWTKSATTAVWTQLAERFTTLMIPLENNSPTT